MEPNLVTNIWQDDSQRMGQSYDGLPSGAVIIENGAINPRRALVLWMLRPKKNAREATSDEPYTCPEETRGSYYSGATRVSLVNAMSRRIINTVRIKQDYNEGADEFDVPYKIRSGSYYRVEGVPDGKEGKPTIIWLKDYNGDGKALEFALFDAQACMGLQTTLIGYSESQDKVIQYPIRLRVNDKGKQTIELRRWADYLFAKEPDRLGHWKYEIDYTGRGGLLDKYDIRYNKQSETFEGAVTSSEIK
jgi:hypothetical protein